METELRDHFSILMTDDQVYITNYEGSSFVIPRKFISHASLIGDKWVSYQMLKLSPFFSMQHLQQIADFFEENDNVINWKATFSTLEFMQSRNKKNAAQKIAS
jgi:hypothetical protein